METEKKTTIIYSEAFKQKVVSEIESGKYSMEEARRVYEIGGSSTISKWIKKMGKNHIIGKVVRIEMPNEKSRIKELEDKVIKLESALARERLNTICYEGMFETAREIYGLDLKKNIGQ